MNPTGPADEDFERIDAEAAAWILRRDRGLGPDEVRELALRIESDPNFRACVERYDQAWSQLDLAGHLKPSEVAIADPDLLAPANQRPRWLKPMLAASAAAAAIALGIGQRAPGEPSQLRDLALDDGSRVELNRDAEIAVEFTPAERRVHLVRGEAQFFIAKDARRPFLVQAGQTEVRAIGTAFDVALAEKAVDVVVTEGRVKLDPNLRQSSGAADHPVALIEAGHRAVVALNDEGTAPRITAVSVEEMDRILAWQPRLMDYTDAPLSTIVTDFNRRNVTQLTIADPKLYSLRISATLRSDNVAGFVRLLEASFGVSATHRGPVEIALVRAP